MTIDQIYKYEYKKNKLLWEEILIYHTISCICVEISGSSQCNGRVCSIYRLCSAISKQRENAEMLLLKLEIEYL